MTLPIEDVDRLRQLEESLWRPESRFDREHMRQVHAPDFLEFGRSSRIYRFEDALSVERQEITAKLPLPNLEIRMMHPDVVLVTYESDVAYASGRERARRSSLWTRTPGTRTPEGWQLRFHQGTVRQKGGQRLASLEKLGAALSTRAPERTDDHLAIIEGVVEVAAE